uniref:Leucine--tRNA ligase RagD-binding domain-containing protein n=1 Tax=Meloidogyne enterolobii TaxID=390850 RepID=A0A6V7X414_MELEN|nr:unnamed protein product [Meloidogyne enterolobii]
MSTHYRTYLVVVGKNDLIVNSKWPTISTVDKLLLQQSSFVNNAIKEFRQRRDAKLNPKKKDPKKALLPPKAATIYFTKKYPEWKEKAINLMRKLYESNNSTLPDNREIMELLNTTQLPEKKEVMPFVQFVRERVAQNGSAALSVNEDFDQKYVLEQIRDYLLCTLQLEKLDIVDIANATENAKEVVEVIKSCSPGSPLIIYNFEMK